MLSNSARSTFICMAMLALCLGAVPASGQLGTSSADVLRDFKKDPGLIRMSDLLSSYEAGAINKSNAATELQAILEKRRFDKLAVPPLDLLTRMQAICPDCTTTDPFPGTPQPIGGGPIGPIGGPTGPIGGTSGGGTPGGGGPG